MPTRPTFNPTKQAPMFTLTSTSRRDLPTIRRWTREGMPCLTTAAGVLIDLPTAERPIHGTLSIIDPDGNEVPEATWRARLVGRR